LWHPVTGNQDIPGRISILRYPGLTSGEAAAFLCAIQVPGADPPGTNLFFLVIHFLPREVLSVGAYYPAGYTMDYSTPLLDHPELG
tara:strand:- start:311 stop:568 length:258 start_codon:yes stop_codon:yes gene_type:complete